MERLLHQRFMQEICEWMATKGYATGHGDTVVDLLNELDYQARECGAAAEKVRHSMQQANN